MDEIHYKASCGPDGGVLPGAALRLAKGHVWSPGWGLDTPALNEQPWRLIQVSRHVFESMGKVESQTGSNSGQESMEFQKEASSLEEPHFAVTAPSSNQTQEAPTPMAGKVRQDKMFLSPACHQSVELLASGCL